MNLKRTMRGIAGTGLAALASIAVLCSTLVIPVAQAATSVTLPNYYMDGMVFQHDKPFVVKGSAQPGTTVTVRIGDRQASAMAGGTGLFSVEVPASPARLDPYALTVSTNGTTVKTINKVYSGEVVVDAGQSNMDASYERFYADKNKVTANLDGRITLDQLPALVDDANIHFVKADWQADSSKAAFDLPLRYSTTSWLNAHNDAGRLSYVAQYAAAEIRAKEPTMPVGVFDLAWSGTYLARHVSGGDLWNTHYAPLTGINAMGILWYQGESDAGSNVTPQLRRDQYLRLWPKFLKDLRSNFGDDSLPFVEAQLARHYDPSYYYFPIQAIQASTAATTANVGMVSTLDTDKGAPILHPLGKEIVGRRMADQLLALHDGTSAPSGPIASKATANGKTVTVEFKYGDGLKTCTPVYSMSATYDHVCDDDQSGDVHEVEIAGTDGVFHKADAHVSGSTLTATADDIHGTPTQIRYAADSLAADPNLYNGIGQPSGAFLLDIAGASPATVRYVMFRPNGGNRPIVPGQGTVGTAITLPSDLSKNGYRLKGWCADSKGEGVINKPGASYTIPSSSTELFAIWEKTDGAPSTPMTPTTHTVAFDANGGTGSVASISFADGGKVRIPDGAALTRSGFDFAGWNTKADGSGTAVPANQEITGGNADIILYAQWKAESSPSQPGTADGSETHKRITLTDKRKNLYRITLDAKGTGSTNKAVIPSDVVLLVDETNSMRECSDGSTKADTGIPCKNGASKRDNLGSIVDKAVTAILATNQGRPTDQQSRVSVVRFAGRRANYPPVAVSGFTTDKATALPAGWNNGDDLWQKGTDWGDALENVGKAGQPRTNVHKQVVLITDGLSNASADDYTQVGTTFDSAFAPADEATVQKKIKAYTLANQRALKAVDSLVAEGWNLRVVGVNADASAAAAGNGFRRAGQYPYVNSNGDLGFYRKGSQPAGWLPQIEWLAAMARKAGDTSATGFDFKATDIDSIVNALTSMVITTSTMRNAVITDPLSDWVDPVGLTDGKGTGITVTKDGKAMTSGYTAAYNAKTRTVTVRFDGDLADGSVYAASFAVTPSDKAITDHRSGAAYPDTGDPDTGETSAGKKGYVSNKDAVLSWNDVTTTNGAESSTAARASYPHPVVQAPSIPIIQALPDAGNRITLLTVLASAGCLISLLGLGAVLAYRRTYGK